MADPLLPATYAGNSSVKRPTTAWTVRRKPVAPMPKFARRTYSISWLDHAGNIEDSTFKAPAIQVFEEAFSAFARGTLIPTEFGPIAVEDLTPGIRVETADGAFEPILWIGSMSVVPAAHSGRDTNSSLYRIASDSFGMGRPAPDLMLGPNARYLMTSDTLSNYVGTSKALAPASALVDGMNVIEIHPVSAVQTFHIATRRHNIIRANGVELETYHPGANSTTRLPGELREQFLRMFPHILEMADFGPMCFPRLSMGDLEHMEAA